MIGAAVAKTMTRETSTEAVDEISDEARKCLDRFEALGFSNGRALDILGVAALSLLKTTADPEAEFDAWWGRIGRLCR